MKLVIKLSKGKSRPIGYISPGGFVKTAKGWRKAPKKGITATVKKEAAPAKSKATSAVMYTVRNAARNMPYADSKYVYNALDRGWDPTATAAKMGKLPSPERKRFILLSDARTFLKLKASKKEGSTVSRAVEARKTSGVGVVAVKAPPSQKRAIPSPRFKGPRSKGKGRTK